MESSDQASRCTLLGLGAILFALGLGSSKIAWLLELLAQRGLYGPTLALILFSRLILLAISGLWKDGMRLSSYSDNINILNPIN